MILKHALQGLIMILKFITMPKICVIKLGFVRISCQQRFFICSIRTMVLIKFSHTYIVKTLVLLISHPVRIYCVDFGRKIWKTSIFGKKCRKHRFWVKNLENIELGQKCEKHRFWVINLEFIDFRSKSRDN